MLWLAHSCLRNKRIDSPVLTDSISTRGGMEAQIQVTFPAEAGHRSERWGTIKNGRKTRNSERVLLPSTNDHARPPSIRWTVENCQRLLDLDFEVRKGPLRSVRDRLLAAWNMMYLTLRTTKCILAKKLGTLRTEMLSCNGVREEGKPARPSIEG